MGAFIGAYPDLFVAGAAFSGVPYGCFAGSSNCKTYFAFNFLTL
jgi:acetylxylan esterase